jgi:hypothetical protein
MWVRSHRVKSGHSIGSQAQKRHNAKNNTYFRTLTGHLFSHDSLPQQLESAPFCLPSCICLIPLEHKPHLVDIGFHFLDPSYGSLLAMNRQHAFQYQYSFIFNRRGESGETETSLADIHHHTLDKGTFSSVLVFRRKLPKRLTSTLSPFVTAFFMMSNIVFVITSV